MRNQQEAERAEQQRIKNLVLNYDLTDDQQDGIDEPAFHYIPSPNSKRMRLVGKGSLNKSFAPTHKGGGRSQRSTGYSRDDDAQEKELKKTPLSPLPVNNINHPDSLADNSGTLEILHGPPRTDKSGNTRSKQRSRKLQFSDVDGAWYANKSHSTPGDPSAVQTTSLDDYIVDKKQKHGTSWRGRGNDQSEK